MLCFVLFSDHDNHWITPVPEFCRKIWWRQVPIWYSSCKAQSTNQARLIHFTVIDEDCFQVLSIPASWHLPDCLMSEYVQILDIEGWRCEYQPSRHTAIQPRIKIANLLYNIYRSTPLEIRTMLKHLKRWPHTPIPDSKKRLHYRKRTGVTMMILNVPNVYSRVRC